MPSMRSPSFNCNVTFNENSSAFGGLGSAASNAPVCCTIFLAAGQWSGWVCVNTIHLMRSRIAPPMIAAMWPSSSGPGSITATSSMPTR